MNQSDYQHAVRRVLENATPMAKKKIASVAAKIPASAKQACITIHIDQYGEGFLDVRMDLDGPDLYVLNKSIKDRAYIFKTKFEDEGLSSGLPLMDPDECEFSVHDTLADCAVEWIVGLWNEIDQQLFDIPVSVEVHDCYGALAPTPVALKS